MNEDQRALAFLAHFLQAFCYFIGPLTIYLMKRESPFVAFHALQALIWQVIYLALWMVSFVALFAFAFAGISAHSSPQGPPPTFFLFFPLFWLVIGGGWVLTLILGIVYGIRANRGEWAGYPLIGRWARRIVGI